METDTDPNGSLGDFHGERTREVRKIQVIIQIAADVARTLQTGVAPSNHSREIMTMEEELGVVLEPLHPGVDDDDMARFFMIQMPDTATAERVIARLRLSDSIEAAYLKPTDEAPEEEIAET